MFYSSEILNIKSNANLGIVWLAATLGPKSNAKRLARKDLTSINVQDTCAFLLNPPEPLSLRLSANLMIGVSRVYGQQCHYHFTDVQGLCTKISHVNTPANPDAIDLPNHEKKGTNITLKKSAVNVLPGDALNFPDLDISSLLIENQAVGRTSLSSNPSAEIGRKSMLLGTPFSTTSSSTLSNALHGSDFANAISYSDYGSMNDHSDIPFSEEFNNQRFVRPRIEDSDDSMEFQVPDQLQQKKKRLKRFINSLMDHDLMLEKDELFINENEMLTNTIASTVTDPFAAALKLLKSPDEFFIPGTFDAIFSCDRLSFNYKGNNAKKNKKIDQKTINDGLTTASDFHFDNENDGFDYDGGIEMYRNENTLSSSSITTPSTLILPWSNASSSSDKQRLLSSVLNTPIRKNGNSTPSPLDEINELKLTSSSSNSSFSSSSFQTFPSENLSLSQETFDFFYFLVDSLPSKSGYLGNVLKRESMSRPIAARALHHLLELKSNNLIDVKQLKPFSDIKISII